MPGAVPTFRNKGRELLMIFARNPEKGKVKTRLARTVGDANALRIYLELMEHTARVVEPLDLDRVVHYSESPHSKDPLNRAYLSKKLQSEGGLGERMANAFLDAFSNGYERVVIIGTDCYELTTRHLQDAFKALRYDQEVVIGPASDGGYYLLGLSRYIPSLFQDKSWGGSDVLLDTLVDLKQDGAAYHLLPTLNDVDEEEDLGELRGSIQEDGE
ncbi:MAG: TIGR04282 family arsenosugar biosynthesis glycosyltransferase [Flavobacteriales bacterium]